MAAPVRARRLSDEEGQTLLRIVRRGKHDTVRYRRALIVMASASGTPVPAIARLVAAHEDTVRDVIHAFNAIGLAALHPRWAGGRPRLSSPDERRYLIATALNRPQKLGRPFTHWSIRKLVGYLADNPVRVVAVSRNGCGGCCAKSTSPSSAPAPGRSRPTRTRTPNSTGSRR